MVCVIQVCWQLARRIRIYPDPACKLSAVGFSTRIWSFFVLFVYHCVIIHQYSVTEKLRKCVDQLHLYTVLISHGQKKVAQSRKSISMDTKACYFCAWFQASGAMWGLAFLWYNAPSHPKKVKTLSFLNYSAFSPTHLLISQSVAFDIAE